MGGGHPGEGGEFGGGIEVDVGVDYGDCPGLGRGGHFGLVVVDGCGMDVSGLVVVLSLGEVERCVVEIVNIGRNSGE